MPSHMVGGTLAAGPPRSGMKWDSGSEADYKDYKFYTRWNEIISKHNILCVHKFDDPTTFYEICRRILFTTVADIVYYF